MHAPCMVVIVSVRGRPGSGPCDLDTWLHRGAYTETHRCTPNATRCHRPQRGGLDRGHGTGVCIATVRAWAQAEGYARGWRAGCLPLYQELVASVQHPAAGGYWQVSFGRRGRGHPDRLAWGFHVRCSGGPGAAESRCEGRPMQQQLSTLPLSSPQWPVQPAALAVPPLSRHVSVRGVREAVVCANETAAALRWLYGSWQGLALVGSCNWRGLHVHI